jgi:hypothetical protein
MDLPPMSSCADFLSRTAAATVRAASGTNAEPASAYMAELALDDGWETEEVPPPRGYAHFIAGALLWAAGERVQTLRWCVMTDPPHVLSVAELARAAAEAAALSMWLGDEVPAPERLRRLLGVTAASVEQQKGLRQHRGGASTSGPEEAILAWGHRQGIRRDRPPTRTDLLVRADPRWGKRDYKRLSAAAHTELPLLQSAWLEVVDAQENADPALIRGHTWSTSLTGAYYTLLACRRRWRLKGHDDDEEVAGLLSELGHWASELDRALGDA